MHSQGVLLVAPALAYGAFDVYGGEEIHLYNLKPGSLAFFAASPAHVEAEAACLETANLGIRCGLEELAYVSEHIGEGGGVAARGPAYGTLVHLYYLVYMVKPFYAAVFQGVHLGVEEVVFQYGHERV